jgi:hypothetical protein
MVDLLCLLAFTLTLLPSTAANPLDQRAICPKLNTVVQLFGAAAPASSFCSSYLKYTASTTTSYSV